MPPLRPMMPPRPSLERSYRSLRAVGCNAETAYALAKAEVLADARDLVCVFEEEPERWEDVHGTGPDACPRPEHVFLAYVVHRDHPHDVLASLGMIGVNDCADPYLRIVRAELFAEALQTLDERERVRTKATRTTQARAQQEADGGPFFIVP